MRFSAPYVDSEFQAIVLLLAPAHLRIHLVTSVTKVRKMKGTFEFINKCAF